MARQKVGKNRPVTDKKKQRAGIRKPWDRKPQSSNKTSRGHKKTTGQEGTGQT